MNANNCCFAIAFVSSEITEVSQIGKTYPNKAIDIIFQTYNNNFGDFPKLALPRLKIANNYSRWRSLTGKWGTNHSKSKKEYLNHFTRERWNGFSLADKRQHSFNDCKACEENETLQIRRLFINGKKVIKSPKRTIKITIPTIPPRQYHYLGVPLNTALSNVNDTKLEKKKTKVEKRKGRREGERNIKEKVEKTLMETALIRGFGNDTSLNRQRQDRLCQSFQPACDVVKPKKRRPGHSLLDNYDFDREKLLEEVLSSTSINLSKLITMFHYMVK